MARFLSTTTLLSLLLSALFTTMMVMMVMMMPIHLGSNAQEIVGGYSPSAAPDVPDDILAAIRNKMFGSTSNTTTQQMPVVCSYETQVVAGTNHKVTIAPTQQDCGKEGETATFTVFEPLPSSPDTTLQVKLMNPAATTSMPPDAEEEDDNDEEFDDNELALANERGDGGVSFRNSVGGFPGGDGDSFPPFPGGGGGFPGGGGSSRCNPFRDPNCLGNAISNCVMNGISVGENIGATACAEIRSTCSPRQGYGVGAYQSDAADNIVLQILCNTADVNSCVASYENTLRGYCKDLWNTDCGRRVAKKYYQYCRVDGPTIGPDPTTPPRPPHHGGGGGHHHHHRRHHCKREGDMIFGTSTAIQACRAADCSCANLTPFPGRTCVETPKGERLRCE